MLAHPNPIIRREPLEGSSVGVTKCAYADVDRGRKVEGSGRGMKVTVCSRVAVTVDTVNTVWTPGGVDRHN